MRDIVLPIHIIAVAAWLGGNFTQAFLSMKFEAAGGASASLWHKASGEMAKIYYSVAGVITLVTGVLLVIDNDVYEFSQFFVSLGFLTVIVGGVMGVLFFAPTSRKAQQAHEAGDVSAIDALQKRMMAGGIFDTALVILTIFAMVGAWGA